MSGIFSSPQARQANAVAQTPLNPEALAERNKTNLERLRNRRLGRRGSGGRNNSMLGKKDPDPSSSDDSLL